MIHHDRPTRIVAACLSAVAGFVDAIGFIEMGGFFVSFMSGNTTRMAVGIHEGTGAAGLAAGLIALFVSGVVAGSLVGRWAGRHRRPAVLVLVALLLAASPLLAGAGTWGFAVAAMALAMGAENAVFERDGEVKIGLTYMTGTLVKLGQRLAAALTGGDRWAWAPFLLLWMGLAAGAVAGAACYPLMGLHALWIAAGASVVLAVAASRLKD
jgi:uncharacterized membrane protein YoaK (UPF0700 family)